MKKGYIWVSAVLYIALGVIAISLVLTSTLPLIDKLKDKNIYTESKDLVYYMDKNIRLVFNEGPGSQRLLSPFIVRAGNFYIDENDFNTINWSFKTKALILEPGANKTEGYMYITSLPTNIEGENLIEASVTYTNVDINLSSQFRNPFLGSYSIIVKNTGAIKNGKTVVNVIVN
jgi:hypothetical protein